MKREEISSDRLVAVTAPSIWISNPRLREFEFSPVGKTPRLYLSIIFGICVNLWFSKLAR